MKKEHAPGFNAGISSLLVIFVILCLVTFAALSLTSANADYKLSLKTMDHTTAYYDASNTAQDILTEIDSRLYNTYAKADSSDGYFRQIQNLDYSGTDYGLSFADDLNQLTFTVPVTEQEQLYVALNIIYPENSGDCFYHILSWTLENTGNWQPNNSMNLLNSIN